MSYMAYAVLMIQPRSETGWAYSTVIGAAVFSEPYPTLPGHVSVVLFEESGDTLEQAMQLARNQLAERAYDWCGEMVDHVGRGPYRDARGKL